MLDVTIPRMRAVRVLARSAVAAIAVAASSCSSPTSACDDPRATSGFNTIMVSCIPSASDARCSATAYNYNTYTCGTTSKDVTALATFISSDPSVATFGTPGVAPGYVTAVGTGNVTITASYANLDVIESARMFFSPGVASENLVDLTVSVRNAVTLATIAGASVTVTPDKGVSQTCATNQFGSCRVQQLRHGVFVIAATASNYQPGQSTLGSGPTAISLTTKLDLIPKLP